MVTENWGIVFRSWSSTKRVFWAPEKWKQKADQKINKFKKINKFELTNRNPQQEVHNNQEENNNPLKINPNWIFQSSEKDQKQFFCNTTCFVTQFSRILIKSKFFETAKSREVPPARDSGGIPPVRFLWRRVGLGEWAQEAVWGEGRTIIGKTKKYANNNCCLLLGSTPN